MTFRCKALLLCQVSLTVVGAGQRVSRKTVASRTLAPASSPRTPTYEADAPGELHVACGRELVAITATNSTLLRVLAALARCTETTLEVGDQVGNERITVRLRPQEPMLAFKALLDGSFSYLIVGSAKDPQRVKRLIVGTWEHVTAEVTESRSARDDKQRQPVQQPPAPATFVDGAGITRLPSGLTPDEALLSQEQLAQKFEASRSAQMVNKEETAEEVKRMPDKRPE